MPHADYYKSGDWNAVCSLCNGKFKASELRKHWQGMYRCVKCWEPRQPQDFVKAGPPEMPPSWAQPETDTFIQICTLLGSTAIPGYMIPGCSIPGVELYPGYQVNPNDSGLATGLNQNAAYIFTAGTRDLAPDVLYGYLSTGVPILDFGTLVSQNTLAAGTVLLSCYTILHPDLTKDLSLEIFSTIPIVFGVKRFSISGIGNFSESQYSSAVYNNNSFGSVSEYPYQYSISVPIDSYPLMQVGTQYTLQFLELGFATTINP